MTVELSSLADLGTLLMEDTARVLERVHGALTESAQLLEDEAKSEFGTYQQGIGPFPA